MSRSTGGWSEFARILFVACLALVAAGPELAAQIDSVAVKTGNPGVQTDRLVVTTSTAGAIATIRVQESRLQLSTNGILNVATAVPASPVAGDVYYSGGSVLYYDGSWRTFARTGDSSAGYVLLGPASAQASASANPPIFIDETNAGSPNLLQLQVSAANRFVVDNNGYVATGEWRATPIGPAYGGTGQSAVATGDLLYGSGAGVWSRRAGPSGGGQYLRSSAANAFLWSAIQPGDLPAGSGYYLARNASDASSASVAAGYLYTFSNSSATAAGGVYCVASAGYGLRADVTGGAPGYAIFGWNQSTGAGNQIGTYGAAVGATATNVGVFGTANNGTTSTYGVHGRASGTSANNRGVFGQADGAAGTKYGVYGDASGAGTTNYGVYGSAAGATTNWAGYFAGNVLASGRITSTLATGTSPFSIASTTVNANLNADMVDGQHYDTDWNIWNDAGTYVHPTTASVNDLRIYDDGQTYGIYESQNNTSQAGTWYGAYLYRSGTNATAAGYGLYARSEVYGGGGTGGTFYGLYGVAQWGSNSYGVYGRGEYAISTSYGVYGVAAGAGGSRSIGVYGYASGSASNFAGYFENTVMVTNTGSAIVDPYAGVVVLGRGNLQVTGNETASGWGAGTYPRLRVGNAWGYAGMYAESNTSGGNMDLVLGATSGSVRIGPGGGTEQTLHVPDGGFYGLLCYGNTYGVFSTATSAFSYGGFFQCNGTWAYVGDNWNGRKITGNGGVSEAVSHEVHGRVTLTCPESPEYWYVDYGTAKLVEGEAWIELDPILRDITVVDAENPMRVYVQVNSDDAFDVAVHKEKTGFRLVERGGGSHSCDVDYTIVLRPRTNFGEGRFPYSPPPAYLPREQDPAAARTKNKPDRTRVFRHDPDWKVFGYDPADYAAVGSEVSAGPSQGLIKTEDGSCVTKEEWARRMRERTPLAQPEGGGPPPVEDRPNRDR